jgi:hypothetical protein
MKPPRFSIVIDYDNFYISLWKENNKIEWTCYNFSSKNPGVKGISESIDLAIKEALRSLDLDLDDYFNDIYYSLR